MARRPAHLPDWIFGASGKRRVLATILDPANAEQEWTERTLATRVGLGSRGSVDEHLDALTQMGLMSRGGRPPTYALRAPWELDPGRRRIHEALAALLPAVEELPDEPVQRPHRDG